MDKQELRAFSWKLKFESENATVFFFYWTGITKLSDFCLRIGKRKKWPIFFFFFQNFTWMNKSYTDCAYIWYITVLKVSLKKMGLAFTHDLDLWGLDLTATLERKSLAFRVFEKSIVPCSCKMTENSGVHVPDQQVTVSPNSANKKKKKRKSTANTRSKIHQLCLGKH